MNHKVRHACIEYISHGVFICIAYIFYFQLPYFQNLLQSPAKSILIIIFAIYFMAGLPYFILRNYFWPQIYLKSQNKSTITLKFLIQAFPNTLNIFKTFPTKRNFMDITLDEKTRVALLSIIVKFFYFPVMLSFLVGNFQAAKSLWSSHPKNLPGIYLFTNWGYYLIYNCIFIIDTAIFTFGYAFEAKWLRNEIKSVDPYLSGWVFALICYPPFSMAVDSFLQYKQSFNYFFYPIFMYIQIGTLFLYLIYVWATVALWTKSSNLTNRGIISRGPYQFVRHPAYAAKNIAWWLEKIPYMTSWVGIVFLVVWNSIYIMRALTEERHLLADPAYQEYVKKVRWRFIPGVV